MERKLIALQIQAITRCSENESERLAELFEPSTLNKGQVIQIGKEQFRSIFYVFSGLVQLGQKPEDIEFNSQAPGPFKTLALYQPNEIFFYPFGGTQYSSIYQLHAITDSQLFLANYEELEKLIQHRPTIMRHYISIGEYYLKQTFQHLQLLQQPTAISRYEQLLRHFGKHFYLIPNAYKASYIGISRKHLTRLNRILLKSPKPNNQ